ncbi:hypothetical protein HDV06_003615 [Boothiomyces sp. JEL0866]|nr:hypothetical protein HDV06_003615 [Boothiomyces sp. JEL0866]
MSDIWEDEDSDYERKMADKEWNRLQDQHGVIGYTEGVDEAKERYLQVGFDEGYSIGSKIGLEIGKIQFKVDFLLSDMKCKLADDPGLESKIQLLEDFKTRLKNLKFDHIFTKEWFKENSVNPLEFSKIVKEFNSISNKM